MVTNYQYLKALSICREYQAQINNEVNSLQPQTIADFIKTNLISRRLKNVLHMAIECGHVYVNELNEHTLRKLRTCGVGTMQEFQLLINK
jgi:glycerol-3-phosphate dehydrogenase